MIPGIIICLVFGYIMGCFSTAYFVGKLNKVDIRQYGSGNMGTTNALRTLGAKAGAITLVGDVLKAVIAILLVKYVFYPGAERLDLFSIYTGLGVVIGHNYPFWLKFKGGKGMAATGGVMASVDPWIIPVGLPLFVLSILITKYVSVGSLAIAVLFPIWIAIRHPGDLHMLAVALVFMALAFLKHRSNIRRLINGTENKIGQRVKM
ncbi:glycerol-3-phosphate acyltransferase PlsY [Anaerotaenia torta]|uniref:glycerol-3-phosphate 1-O-acyltransferase PlsY n=1 Tax=Anaerotaenia torta TaxID=433293 RepID=UPI003D19C663